MTIQDQRDPLAAAVLQNRRGLDLLTADKGGTLPLPKGGGFYMNQSGLVRDTVHQLQDQIVRRRQGLANSQGNWYNI